MDKHYKLPDGSIQARKETTQVPSDWMHVTVEQINAEREASKTPAQIQEEAIAHYKGLYLGVVQDKLKSLDYDSLATVKLWEGDATFGAEATRILVWYKAIIQRNYELLNAGVPLTDEEYLVEINAVVF